MKIIYKNTDNSINIIHPTKEALDLFSIDDIAKKDVPNGLDYIIVEDNVIPTDRTFRESWEFDGVAVLENNDKAIEATKEKIRAYRDVKLQELDVQFQRALETGSDTTEIVNQKQYYRDMPTQADNKTIDELKEIIDLIEG